MFTRKQTIEIIDKLIELTQHAQIVWRCSESYDRSMTSSESYVDSVYICTYLGRNIRVYNQRFKHYVDDDKFFWDEDVKIDFVDSNESPLGSLPHAPNASELLRVIQFQNPNINSFYRDLLRGNNS